MLVAANVPNLPLRTLKQDQCDRYFNIQFVDYNVELNCLEEAVREEMKGPCNLLGDRVLHKKIREIHGVRHDE